ncbi:mitochondrial 37S ribosomal protein uS2m [Apiospora kogelbergensis]|uniref:mitochondrial 37S ribosomal protein uS2m n=1 Tax=Apiospora kogelbergensis TaxID=1337665 RepID=UPI0031313BEB
MIIREFGVRHGRKVLAAPLRRGQQCLRSLSTETSGTPVATADPAVEAALQTNPEAPRVPSLFARAAKPARRRPVVPDTTKADWETAQKLKRSLAPVGAVVEHRYSPGDVFRNPPGPKDVTLELLMASQAHMGHHASVWNPANARYIYGVRNGVHIISLEQTAAHLRRAARVVEEVAYHGGLILFVGTRPGQTQIVTQAARLAKACHLFTKWTPGTITNSDKILPGIPIEVVNEFDQPVAGFDQHLMDRRALVPDLVVCLNPLENFTMLRECSQANVPTIGIVDTNTEPTWVTYAIPANDDSLRCLAVIGSVLGRAGEAGQKRRMEDAHNGKVTWNTPSEIKQFIEIQQKRAKWTVRSEAEEAGKKDGEKDEGNGVETPGRDFSAAKGGRDQPYDEALAELQAEVDAASEADVGSLLRNASRGKN